MTTPAQLIALLNSLSFGDLDAIRAKLAEARGELESLGHGDVAALVADASAALAGGDLKTYRRRVETAVAKIGHLR